MNRLVCDCVNVYEDEIEKSFLKNKGNLEFVIEETQATLACTRCLEENCSKVDISFPDFIKELNDKYSF